MDKNIIKIMKSYKISDLEINDILAVSPMMDVITYEDFVENCKILMGYGYPKSDLDILMLANPNIFVKSAKDLREELVALKEDYLDIEMVLKQDPTII